MKMELLTALKISCSTKAKYIFEKQLVKTNIEDIYTKKYECIF